MRVSVHWQDKLFQGQRSSCVDLGLALVEHTPPLAGLALLNVHPVLQAALHSVLRLHCAAQHALHIAVQGCTVQAEQGA